MLTKYFYTRYILEQIKGKWDGLVWAGRSHKHEKNIIKKIKRSRGDGSYYYTVPAR